MPTQGGLAIEEVTEEGEIRIVSKFRMYDLRHTHATILLRANVNPKIVSERLGHASVALTLDVYSHVLPTMQSSAVAAIANALYSKDEEGDILPLN